jgi:hypothetical protein
MSILEKKLEACRVCGETDTAGSHFFIHYLDFLI